jgi:5-oxoprolinase (ATP-hydrolysing) subunit A
MNPRIKGIDINADLGEGIDNEKELMAFLSSCNIACGGHYGDILSISSTIKAAKEMGLNIGAHPSYPDKINFGRVSIKMNRQELFKVLLEQLLLFQKLCVENQVDFHHIKPHGALYNDAATNTEIAEVIVQLIKAHFPKVKLMGMPNSIIEKIAIAHEIPFIREAFADRNYLKPDQLVPRTEVNAVINHPNDVLNQVKNIALHHQIVNIHGESFNIHADSICFHGDHPQALVFLQKVSTHL